MKNKYNKRKGATLAELIIVLAVLVIASTMVVSFSSMMHGAQGISNERFEAMQDVTAAESIIEGFIENINYGIPGKLESANKLSFSTLNNGTYDKFVTFNNGFIVACYGEDSQVAMELEHINSITFKVLTPDGEIAENDNILTTNDVLYYCTINYFVDKTNYTYTFCVNPYVGEGGN